MLKKQLLILVLSALLNNNSYCDNVTKSYSVQNINLNRIKEKEIHFEKLFSKKEKIKKTLYVAVGISSIAASTCYGYNRWNKKQKKKKIDQEEKTEISEMVYSNTFPDKKQCKYSLKNLTKYSLYKGIKTGAVLGISGGITYAGTNAFKALKNKLKSFYSRNDIFYFAKIAKSIKLCIDQLNIIFSITNEQQKAEIADNYTFLLENIENFIALSSTLIDKNYLQIFYNEMNLIIRNIEDFSKKLNTILNTTNFEYIDTKNSDLLLSNFNQLSSKTLRFINFANLIIYES